MIWDQWCAEECQGVCRINVSVVCGVARVGVVDNKISAGLVIMDACAGVVVNKTCVGLVVMDAWAGVVVNKTCVGLVVMDACAGVVVRNGCASLVGNAFVSLVVGYAINCRCIRNPVLRMVKFLVVVSSDTRPRGDQYNGAKHGKCNDGPLERTLLLIDVILKFVFKYGHLPWGRGCSEENTYWNNTNITQKDR